MEKRAEDWEQNVEIKQEGTLQLYSFDPKKFSNGGTMLTKSMPVFYNPIQELNRSITLIAYRSYQKDFQKRQQVKAERYEQGHNDENDKKPNEVEKNDNSMPSLRILDSMAASGIRALRLAQFLPEPKNIIANDLNPLALKLIKKNIALNNIHSQIELTNRDCQDLLSQSAVSREYFHIIDIDPFGTPNYFIPNALRAIEKEGLMGVTATDMPVLFGIRPSACLRKYNVTSLRSTFTKEVGLRILLHYIAKLAHPLMRYIEPVMSLSFDHYVRVFVRIHKGKEGVNNNLHQFGYIFWCPKCDWRTSHSLDITQSPQECPSCHGKIKFGGPLWLGPLHDEEFVTDCINITKESTKQILPSKNRILKTLQYVRDETTMPPGFYNIHKMCDRLQLPVSSMKLIQEEIILAGYRSTRTHIDPRALKSDIPVQILTEILQKIAQ